MLSQVSTGQAGPDALTSEPLPTTAGACPSDRRVPARARRDSVRSPAMCAQA